MQFHNGWERVIGPPVGGGLLLGCVAAVGHGGAANVWPFVAVAGIAGDRGLCWLLERSPERTIVRPAWLVAMAWLTAAWFWGLRYPWVIGSLLAVVAAWFALWAGYGLVLRIHDERAAMVKAPPPEESLVRRLCREWAAHSQDLQLQGTTLRYVGQEGDEEHLILTLTPRVGVARVRSTLPQFQVLMSLWGAQSGGWRAQERHDTPHLLDLYMERERPSERLAAIFAEAPTDEPDPAERLDQLLAEAPPEGVSTAEVVQALTHHGPPRSARWVFLQLQKRGRRVKHGRWRARES